MRFKLGLLIKNLKEDDKSLIDEMFMLLDVQSCIYFCVYLSQAVSCPPCIGMEWDLFCRVHLVKELQLELMLGTSRVVVPPLPAEPLR